MSQIQKNPPVEIVEEEQEQKLVDVSVSTEKDQEREEREQERQTFEDVRKAQKRAEYLARQSEKTNRETMARLEKIEGLLTRQPEVDPDSMDEYDRIAQKDWKAAVRKLGQEEARRIIQEERQQAIRERAEYENSEKLAASRKRVYEKYPELGKDDDDSEYTNTFLEIMNEDPSLLQSNTGPEVAMSRMEDRLRQKGRLPRDSKPMVDEEVNRRLRVGASNVPVGRSNEKAVYMPDADKEFCDRNAISYSRFNAFSKKSEKDLREGVSS